MGQVIRPTPLTLQGINLSRVRHDFPYYASKLLKVKQQEPFEAIVSFNLNPIQQKLNQLWEYLLKTQGFVRLIILKARRHGISTYIEGRLFHKATMNEHTNVFIIADDMDHTSTIFEMSRLFYEMLPPELRPMKRYNAKGKHLIFENPSDKARLIEPGLRSRIEVFPAKRVAASRSGGYTGAHLSEVAFFTAAESLIAAIRPSLPTTSPGTVYVLESTANGRGDYFHAEWKRAKNKKSNFYPVFFSWLDHSYYTMSVSDGMRKELTNTLDEEELGLIAKHKATLGQLLWRREMIKDLVGDVELFHQEFPSNDVEAFIASGQCYFNRNKLRVMLDKTSPPIFKGDIGEVEGVIRLTPNEEGPLWIWEMPISKRDYVIGIDTCAGAENRNADEEEGDMAAMEVIKVPVGTYMVEQVAEYMKPIGPVPLAHKAVLLGRLYNEGMLSPEIDKHGLTLLNEIKEVYFNIYRWQYFDRFGKYHTNKLGWDTNVTTKPLLCDYAAACIDSEVLVIRSERLIDQMFSFIRLGNSGEADNNQWDDLVMSYMIALFTLVRSFDVEALLKMLSDQTFKKDLSVTPTREEIERLAQSKGKGKGAPPTFMIDSEFDKSYDKGGGSDFTSGPDGWLNY